MNIIGIVIICCIVLFTLLGGGIGALKGFTKVKSWAIELLLIGGIGIPIGRLITGKVSGGTPVAASVTLGITVFLTVLFMAAFIVLRFVMAKGIEKRKQRSYYEHYDELNDNTEQILTAIGTEDKKQYKQLLKHKKRKIKQTGGVWGILDRVFGGVALAIQGAVLTGIVAAVFISVVDFSRLAQDGGALHAVMGKIYTGGTWKLFRGCLFDFFVIGIIMLCIRSGYSGGLTSSVWGIFIVVLVVGAGLLSWQLTTHVDEFKIVTDNLAANINAKLSGASGILDKVKITPDLLAKIIIAAGLFALMLIAVVIVAIFGPKLIDKARDGFVFRTVDGVLGAIVATIIGLALMLVVGAVVNSLHDFAFMDVFNAYFGKSGIATHIYNRNMLNEIGILKIPFDKWLG